jgi:hypothetical protein
MDPASGPELPAEWRARLEMAHQKFEEAHRQLASRGERMRTTIFGAVGVEDYVRFNVSQAPGFAPRPGKL